MKRLDFHTNIRFHFSPFRLLPLASAIAIIVIDKYAFAGAVVSAATAVRFSMVTRHSSVVQRILVICLRLRLPNLPSAAVNGVS
jgi:hypothetical protein